MLVDVPGHRSLGLDLGIALQERLTDLRFDLRFVQYSSVARIISQIGQLIGLRLLGFTFCILFLTLLMMFTVIFFCFTILTMDRICTITGSSFRNQRVTDIQESIEPKFYTSWNRVINPMPTALSLSVGSFKLLNYPRFLRVIF